MSLNVVHLGLRFHLAGEAWCPLVGAISPGFPGAAGPVYDARPGGGSRSCPHFTAEGGRRWGRAVAPPVLPALCWGVATTLPQGRTHVAGASPRSFARVDAAPTAPPTGPSIKSTG